MEVAQKDINELLYKKMEDLLRKMQTIEKKLSTLETERKPFQNAEYGSFDIEFMASNE